jgi:nitrite reductase (NADH) small subunit
LLGCALAAADVLRAPHLLDMALSVTLCSADAIPEGSGLHFRVDDRDVAVFRRDGRLYALDGLCPHEGAPLGHGDLVGGQVVCARHGWSFDLETGRSDQVPDEPVACFPVRVEDGMVIVELP